MYLTRYTNKLLDLNYINCVNRVHNMYMMEDFKKNVKLHQIPSNKSRRNVFLKAYKSLQVSWHIKRRRKTKTRQRQKQNNLDRKWCNFIQISALVWMI